MGELISDSEADVREEDSYLFDLDNKVVRSEGLGAQSQLPLSLGDTSVLAAPSSAGLPVLRAWRPSSLGPLTPDSVSPVL